MEEKLSWRSNDCAFQQEIQRILAGSRRRKVSLAFPLYKFFTYADRKQGRRSVNGCGSCKLAPFWHGPSSIRRGCSLFWAMGTPPLSSPLLLFPRLFVPGTQPCLTSGFRHARLTSAAINCPYFGHISWRRNHDLYRDH